jgi:hypothetical protein
MVFMRGLKVFWGELNRREEIGMREEDRELDEHLLISIFLTILVESLFVNFMVFIKLLWSQLTENLVFFIIINIILFIQNILYYPVKSIGF